MKKFKILITGACGVTSRSVVRSLNKSELFSGKCEFIGTDICNLYYAPYEGLYEKLYKVPPFNSPDYVSIMKKIIEENEIEYASNKITNGVTIAQDKGIYTFNKYGQKGVKENSMKI